MRLLAALLALTLASCSDHPKVSWEEMLKGKKKLEPVIVVDPEPDPPKPTPEPEPPKPLPPPEPEPDPPPIVVKVPDPKAPAPKPKPKPTRKPTPACPGPPLKYSCNTVCWYAERYTPEELDELRQQGIRMGVIPNRPLSCQEKKQGEDCVKQHCNDTARR